MGFDFFGYDMNVVFLTPDEQGIVGIEPPNTLTLLGQQAHIRNDRFDPALLLLRDCMESMSVEVPASGIPLIEIVLTPPMEIAMRILNSTLLNVGNIIAVKFGYPGQTAQVTDWVAAFLLAPQVSFGVPIRFTLRAQGLGMGLSRTTPSCRWQNGNRLEYLMAALHPYKLEVELEGSLKTSVGRAKTVVTPDSLPFGPLTEAEVIQERIKRIGLTQVKTTEPEAFRLVQPHNCDQNQSDADFVQRMLDESGVISRWENHKLVITRLRDKLAQPPIVGFRWYGQAVTNPSTAGQISPDERLPIISFDSDVTAGFTGPSAVMMQMEGVDPHTYKWKDAAIQHEDRPGVGKVANSGDDPKTPKLTEFVVNRKSYRGEVKPIPLGVLAVAGENEASVQPLRKLIPEKEECPMRVQLPRGGGVGADGKEGHATHHSQELNSMYSNFTAVLKTIGMPRLPVMSIIFVEGIGRYSGNYYVQKIEHTLDSSGFKSTLHLIRTGTDRPAASGSESLKGSKTQNVNDQQPAASFGGREISPKYGDHAAPSDF